jgi:hypothetical protein
LKKPEKPKPIYVPNLKKVQCSAYVYDKNTKHKVQCEKTTMVEDNTSNQNLTWYCKEHWEQLQKGLRFFNEKEEKEESNKPKPRPIHKSLYETERYLAEHENEAPKND